MCPSLYRSLLKLTLSNRAWTATFFKMMMVMMVMMTVMMVMI